MEWTTLHKALECYAWGRVELAVSASHTLTVLSLLAVYSTPLFPIPFAPVPAPPHLTTLTDAVCPPSVYSVRRVRRDQTLTVKSLEEEASLGEEELLMKISKRKGSKRDQNVQMGWLPCE